MKRKRLACLGLMLSVAMVSWSSVYMLATSCDMARVAQPCVIQGWTRTSTAFFILLVTIGWTFIVGWFWEHM